MNSTIAANHDWQEDVVIRVLAACGARGASHEDFVEAGAAPGYISILRRFVDERGMDVRVDFTTGSTRWSLDAVQRRAA